MNCLEEMLKLQKSFQEKFGFNPPLHLIASAIMAEAGELWEASEGKWWSKKKHVNDTRLEELVDILHFFLAYCVRIDVSAKELFERYAQKLEVNYKRQFEGY